MANASFRSAEKFLAIMLIAFSKAPQFNGLAFIRCWSASGLPISVIVGHDVLVRFFALKLCTYADLVKRRAQMKNISCELITDPRYRSYLDEKFIRCCKV